MMTLEEFALVVERMRTAQKEFFRTKSTTALEDARRLERKVDRGLRRLKQKELFDA